MDDDTRKSVRKSWIGYVHDVRDPEDVAQLPFQDQAKTMMADMDALRNGTLTL